jgi:hypothetical protein
MTQSMHGDILSDSSVLLRFVENFSEPSVHADGDPDEAGDASFF